MLRIILFALLLLAGCKSMNEDDKVLWNDSTNAPPNSASQPAK